MELADGSNHVLISSLFHKQSERWLALSSFLISELQEKIEGFVNAALDHIVQGPDVTMELRLQIRKSLRRHYHKATEELNKLWGSTRYPSLTYNHQYTDAVSETRLQPLRDAIQRGKMMQELGQEEFRTVESLSMLSTRYSRILNLY